MREPFWELGHRIKGLRKQKGLPGKEVWLSASGGAQQLNIAYSLDSANREQRILVVRRLADGPTRVITRAAYVSHSVYSWGSPRATGALGVPRA